MYTNHRHYILLIFAVLALAASVFGYSLMRGTVISAAIKSHEMGKEAASVAEREQHAKRITAAYTKLSEDRTKLNSYLVTQEEIVGLIEEFERVGDRTGSAIELSAVSNEEFTTERGLSLSHFKAHVEGRGAWSSLMRALTLIENMPYSLSITNLRILESAEVSAAELSASGDKPVAKPKDWRISFDIRVLTTK